MNKVNILFVCMGNICRSPTAEGVFAHHCEQAGVLDRLLIDSAGTHAYHVGEPPDSRAQQAALARGIDLSQQKARRVGADDFDLFDYILVMDSDNLSTLDNACPAAHKHKIKLFMEFAPDMKTLAVPDPYYGGSNGFDRVLDLIDEASKGLLVHLRQSDF